MWVLMTRLIWATETARLAGSMSLSMRPTAGLRQASARLLKGFENNPGMSASSPRRYSPQSCSPTWASPPTSTATTSAQMGVSSWGARKRAAAMKARLSSTGVKAGSLKDDQVLSTPAARATMEISTM